MPDSSHGKACAALAPYAARHFPPSTETPYRGCTSTRRHRGTAHTRPRALARLAAGCHPPAHAIGPAIALALEPRAYLGVHCWNSRAQRWAHWTVPLAYDLHYTNVRARMCNGGVSRAALVAVAAARARYADHATGRNSRPTNDRLAADTGLSVRTVQRADEALRLLGLATEVLRGRQRTRAERFASWRVGDRARGWASVWALHDNPQLSRVIHSVSSHPRSGPVRDKTFRQEVITTRTARSTSGRQRGATRRKAPDKPGLALAKAWRAHDGAPPWARRHSAAAWASVLAAPARHRWTARDLNQLVTDWLGVGHWIADRPHKPIGLLGAILAWHGRDNLVDRPTALDDARDAAERNRLSHNASAAQHAPAAPSHPVVTGRDALAGRGRAAVQQVLDAAKAGAAARRAERIARDTTAQDAIVQRCRGGNAPS